MSFFWPGVREVDVEAVYRAIGYGVGYKLSGIGAYNADIVQPPSADTVNGITIVFAGPYDTEKIVVRQCSGLVEQEGCLSGADFDMDGAFASENPDKIDFAVQIFGLEGDRGVFL